MGCPGTLPVTLHRMLQVFFLLSLLWRTTTTSATLRALVRSSADNFRTSLGDDGQWLDELANLTKLSRLSVKSRQKRIVPFVLPRGLLFEMKWNIEFELYSFSRFFMDLQLALFNDMFYPREFVAMQEELPLVELIPDVYKPYLLKPPRLLDKEELFGEEGEDEEEEERRRYQVLDRKKREPSRDREIFYRVLEKYIHKYGMPARPCLLRTICELAEVPLQDHLFGQLVTAVFSPSRGSTGPTGEAYDEYLAAEEHGLRRGNCAVHYGDCPASMFDVLPFMEHSFVY